MAGAEPSQHVEFRPLASYAEYVVYPGVRRELKITLSSYAASCDSFVTPGAKDTSVTVTLVAPAEAELAPGSFEWNGHAAHGGSEQQPERAYSLPTVRLGHQGFEFLPGGSLNLQAIATTPDGRVRGRLEFEFPGDAEHPATSLRGSFEAKLCRVRL